jgi:hypothetical protein
MDKKILDNLTLVLPIHNTFNEVDKELFLKAIKSVLITKGYQPKEILIVHTKDIKEYDIDFSIFGDLSYRTLKNDTDKTDYSSQINLAAKNIETEFFQILEQDDEVGETIYTNFVKYTSYYNNLSILMPLTIDVNSETMQYLKFSNCEPLSRGFIREGAIGVLTHEVVENIPSLSLSGSFIRTEEFLNIGGLKASLPISFIYEFFLRATSQDLNIMVLPKTVYLHRNLRKGSYLDNINKENYDKDKVNFWFEKAKKEFYFAKDRG